MQPPASGSNSGSGVPEVDFQGMDTAPDVHFSHPSPPPETILIMAPSGGGGRPDPGQVQEEVGCGEWPSRRVRCLQRLSRQSGARLHSPGFSCSLREPCTTMLERKRTGWGPGLLAQNWALQSPAGKTVQRSTSLRAAFLLVSGNRAAGSPRGHPECSQIDLWGEGGGLSPNSHGKKPMVQKILTSTCPPA